VSPDAPRARGARSQGDLGFRSDRAFAVLVVAIVVGIGVVLTSESWLSIQKFGLGFWQTTTWDPVAGDFGALPFIWGTLYSSILALLIATPVALGIAIFIAELCPASLRMPLVFLTELLAAIPSIVYGLWGIFVLVPAVRQLEIATAAVPQGLPALQRTAARRRHAVGRSDSGDHDHAVHRRRWRARCSSRCRSSSAKPPTRSARRASKPSRRRSTTPAPASSAR
jgi:hypothetical protein